jgi:hypothetical protein
VSRTKAEVVVPTGKLWPRTPSGASFNIEVFGATGEYQSGKTLLGLSIAPGVHPAGHPFAGQPRTLYLDHEKSGGTYGGTGCRRIDVPAEMLAAGKDYTPINVYLFMLEKCNEAKPGQYDVLVVDPVTDVEGGLVAYVRKNCGLFGLTEKQLERAGGLLWGAVKDAWKGDLLKISAKFKCFFFTSHLRDVWAGNVNTGKREPKGKDTLFELASLYVWLERKPDAEGRVPAVPSAIVLKQRLADTMMDDAGNLSIVNLLPPRLPICTAQTIRQYIASPPDYSKLKEGERIVDEKPTEVDMERLRLARAEAERDTAGSRLELLRRQAELVAMNAVAAASAPQSPDRTAAKHQGAADKRTAAAEQAKIDGLKEEAETKLAAVREQEKRLMETQPADVRMAGDHRPEPPTNLATRSQIAEIRELVTKIGLPPEKLMAVLAKAGVMKVGELPPELALKLIESLRKKVANPPFDPTPAA